MRNAVVIIAVRGFVAAAVAVVFVVDAEAVAAAHRHRLLPDVDVPRHCSLLAVAAAAPPDVAAAPVADAAGALRGLIGGRVIVPPWFRFCFGHVVFYARVQYPIMLLY